MFEIYCHTSPDGKQYVGCTSKGYLNRWKGHLRYARKGSPAPLHQAIREHGPDAFTHEVLEVCADVVSASAAEVRWIDIKDTLVPAGYNVKPGGGMIESASPSARHNMSVAQTGKRRRPFARGPQTAAHRAAICAGHFRRKVRAAWVAFEMSF